MGSGFKDDDVYDIYDQPWRNEQSIASNIYRPGKNADNDYSDDYESVVKSKRYVSAPPPPYCAMDVRGDCNGAFFPVLDLNQTNSSPAQTGPKSERVRCNLRRGRKMISLVSLLSWSRPRKEPSGHLRTTVAAVVGTTGNAIGETNFISDTPYSNAIVSQATSIIVSVQTRLAIKFSFFLTEDGMPSMDIYGFVRTPLVDNININGRRSH